jgi:hypothetical protein
MSEDRSEMEAARLAGLQRRHETREARAQTVIGKYGHHAIVQPRDGYVRLWVADETGSSTSAVLLKPEAAERLARILTQTKAIVEASA